MSWTVTPVFNEAAIGGGRPTLEKKKNRSDSYQYRIVEIPIDPGDLADFASSDGLSAHMRHSGHSDEVVALRARLMEEVRRLIATVLTDRQEEVVNLRLEGLTQVEIGVKLGIHQTTVHKTLKGNIDYRNDKAVYGGAFKKLRKICDKDERVQEILREIERVRAMEEEGEE